MFGMSLLIAIQLIKKAFTSASQLFDVLRCKSVRYCRSLLMTAVADSNTTWNGTEVIARSRSLLQKTLIPKNHLIELR